MTVVEDLFEKFFLDINQKPAYKRRIHDDYGFEHFLRDEMSYYLQDHLGYLNLSKNEKTSTYKKVGFLFSKTLNSDKEAVVHAVQKLNQIVKSQCEEWNEIKQLKDETEQRESLLDAMTTFNNVIEITSDLSEDVVFNALKTFYISLPEIPEAICNTWGKELKPYPGMVRRETMYVDIGHRQEWKDKLTVKMKLQRVDLEIVSFENQKPTTNAVELKVYREGGSIDDIKDDLTKIDQLKTSVNKYGCALIAAVNKPDLNEVGGSEWSYNPVYDFAVFNRKKKNKK